MEMPTFVHVWLKAAQGRLSIDVSSIRTGILEWWKVTSASDYLASQFSRRTYWPWLLPITGVLIAFGDVVSWLLAPTYEHTAAALADLMFLAMLVLVSKTQPWSLIPDCIIALYVNASFIWFSVTGALDGRFVLEATPYMIFVGCLFGFHSFFALSLCLTNLCLLPFLDVGSDLVVKNTIPTMAGVAWMGAVAMEYAVASAHRASTQHLEEKRKLLDAATDGWATLDRQTGAFVSFSQRLARTLRREDLLGVPLEALLCAGDHTALRQLLSAAPGAAAPGVKPVPHYDESMLHTLVTFKCSDLVFDARLIVHGLPTASSSAVDICIVIVGEVRQQKALRPADDVEWGYHRVCDSLGGSKTSPSSSSEPSQEESHHVVVSPRAAEAQTSAHAFPPLRGRGWGRLRAKGPESSQTGYDASASELLSVDLEEGY
mmetsp:Transcript_54641/g.130390  ORF Transcript_54641/g.130390 Transcript_54641/m.130390 type:complete len:431 (+) Transcript_54641:89-1381(+)